MLLPWIPSKARNLRDSSTRELYEIVKTIVDDRKQTGRRGEDAMQVLLDEGDGFLKNASVLHPPSRLLRRTLLSEEIDLDGGVTTGVEDLQHTINQFFKTTRQTFSIPGGRGL